MDDDKQTMMGLMSLGVVIITVECGFSLGKELDPGNKVVLFFPLLFAFCAVTIGLIVLYIENGQSYEKWIKTCSMLIWISVVLLIVVSMSGYQV